MLQSVSRPHMAEIYLRYPALQHVEGPDRVSARRSVLKLAPHGGVGAELGVFTGAFSEVLFEVARPAKLYLVDVWHEVFGETYPDWGQYTANGTLTTEAALAAVRFRAAQMAGAAEIVVASSLSWLSTLAPDTLDWAYLDTTHAYPGTMQELPAIARVLKPGGLILGDDCQINPDHPHHGVFRAVRDFTRRGEFEIIHMDHAKQWAMRRSPQA
jgi:SAM-dependent methyltransferase